MENYTVKELKDLCQKKKNSNQNILEEKRLYYCS